MTLNYARLQVPLNEVQTWKCLTKIQIAWVEELLKEMPRFMRLRSPWNLKRVQWQSRYRIELLKATRLYDTWAYALIETTPRGE